MANVKNQSFTNQGLSKDKCFQAQKKVVFEFLKVHTATASMITEATGIPQKNICRFKRDLEKVGLLAETERKLCKVTSFKAWYLTTNPDLFPINNQTQNNSNNGN